MIRQWADKDSPLIGQGFDQEAGAAVVARHALCKRAPPALHCTLNPGAKPQLPGTWSAEAGHRLPGCDQTGPWPGAARAVRLLCTGHGSPQRDQAPALPWPGQALAPLQALAWQARPGPTSLRQRAEHASEHGQRSCAGPDIGRSTALCPGL